MASSRNIFQVDIDRVNALWYYPLMEDEPMKLHLHIVLDLPGREWTPRGMRLDMRIDRENRPHFARRVSEGAKPYLHLPYRD
jgi:hypothetical protein